MAKARQLVQVNYQRGAGRPTMAQMKAMVLPAESQPMRFTCTNATGTVLRRYNSLVSGLSIPAASDASSLIKFGTGAFGESMFILSKQPSRAFAYRSPTDYSRYALYKKAAAYNSITTPGAISPQAYCTFPGNDELESSLAAGVNATKPINLPGDWAHVSLLGTDKFDVTPMGWSSTAVYGTSNAPTPTDHIALDRNGNRYIWLSAGNTANNGSVLSINLRFFRAAVKTAATVSWKTSVALMPYDGDDTTESTPVAQASMTTGFDMTATEGEIKQTVIFDSVGAVSGSTYTGIIPTSGYYRVVVLDSTLATAAANTFTYSYTPDVYLTVQHKAGSLKFEAAPEFSAHPQLYEAARVTSAAFLLSNRAPAIAKGGNVYARTVSGEVGLYDLFSTSDSRAAFFGACAQDSGRFSYEGDVANGLYTWLRPSEADIEFRGYAGDLGSGVYHLSAKLPITVVAALGATATQQLYVHWDMALESVVSRSQTYGNPVISTLTPEQFNAMVRHSAEWPCILENPLHVGELLKRIAVGAWRGFKFLAPHIAKAAAAAAGGAGPLATLGAALL